MTILTLDSLEKAFAGFRAVDGVSFSVSAGEIVAVIGPNGAGKTTLVRVLLGLERQDRGVIQRARDLKIGYAPQRFDRDPALPVTVERFLQLGATGPAASLRGVLEEVGAQNVTGQQL